MTLADIMGMLGASAGNGKAAPPPASAAAPSAPLTPQDRNAYQSYSIACQEVGMQPKPYAAWVKAGRPPT